MSDSKDTVLRAMTDDGSFRVIAANTTDTVQAIAEVQKASGRTIEQLANLLTGTILVRETMAPQYRVQGILRGAGNGGTLVADSQPDGSNRGLVQLPSKAVEVTLGPGARLQMMRTLLNGQINQGVVALDDAKTLSDGLMTYMQSSEQVTSVIDVACVVQGDRVTAAGGYLVQLLPEVAEGVLAVMTERLTLFDRVDALLRQGTLSPKELTAELLYGMPYGETGSAALRFGCTCSHVRIVAGLATLDRTELQSLHGSGETLQISCDFCGKDYEIAPEQLRGLLDSN